MRLACFSSEDIRIGLVLRPIFSDAQRERERLNNCGIQIKDEMNTGQVLLHQSRVAVQEVHMAVLENSRVTRPKTKAVWEHMMSESQIKSCIH